MASVTSTPYRRFTILNDARTRAENPLRFLRERIFREHPPEVQAVGFTTTACTGFPGVLDAQADDYDERREAFKDANAESFLSRLTRL